MDTVVALNQIRYRYAGAAANVVEKFSIAIRRREFVALVGGSGVGKSTLLRIAAGLTSPDAGEVRISTERLAGRRRRAMVFQDGRLMPWRTVRANVGLGLEGLDLDASTKRDRIAEVLVTTGVAELADRWPHQLSGGQTQRVGIARALAVQPDILLMDEPFSAVDAITRRRLQAELIRIWQSSACAVLFVTHDIEEAALLADRIIVLGGSPARILEELSVPQPRDERLGSPAVLSLTEQISNRLREVA